MSMFDGVVNKFKEVINQGSDLEDAAYSQLEEDVFSSGDIDNRTLLAGSKATKC